jgi:diaminopimelate epimerase
MKLKFTKMQGLGNDFVVLDGVRTTLDVTPALARRLADRHFGIGCDQILIVEPSAIADVDFRYRIFNADGGEVSQCGNGARCFARFVRDKGLTAKDEIRVQTRSGVIAPRLEANGEVTVDMGPPVFEPARIPFTSDSDVLVQALDVNGVAREITALSMGNPHAVQVVAGVERAPVLAEGPLVENHPRFPERVNAGYAEVVDRHRLKLRVWERGAGETLACGTGACAAAVACIRRGLVDSPVRVSTHGGDLTIRWDGEDNPVLMTGPAVAVFDGEIDLDESRA